MKLQIKVGDDGVIEKAVFKTFGCGSAIASSSYATEILEGKKIEDAMKAREAAKDAARLKDMTAAQRQWELESRILRAINEEKTALAKQDEARATKAQAAQEEALKKLIQDPITPDYVVKKYADMVKAIESQPSMKVKMTIQMHEGTDLPRQLQDLIRAPGGGYELVFKETVIPVVPVLITDGDDALLRQWDAMQQTPSGDDLPREADKTGANP
jgi:NifU-like protein involved in Fe-S cluster formation